jgi:hypothetical protein
MEPKPNYPYREAVTTLKSEVKPSEQKMDQTSSHALQGPVPFCVGSKIHALRLREREVSAECGTRAREGGHGQPRPGNQSTERDRSPLITWLWEIGNSKGSEDRRHKTRELDESIIATQQIIRCHGHPCRPMMPAGSHQQLRRQREGPKFSNHTCFLLCTHGDLLICTSQKNGATFASEF